MNKIAGLTPRKGSHLLSGDLGARPPNTRAGANAYEGLPETPPLDEKIVPLEMHRRNGDQGRYLGMQAGRKNGR